MKTMLKRAGLVLALVTFLMPLGAFAQDAQADAELERMQELYRTITSYHMLLRGDGVTKAMVDSALYDVERYVEELDSRYATDKLFISDPRVLGELTTVVAKAHFQVALLHARGVDLEGSILEYERVVDLLGYDPSDWEEDIERGAKAGLLTGVNELVFEIAKPRDVVADLKHFWASGVVTRVEVHEFSPDQLGSVTLERVGGRNDAFSKAAFSVAHARFLERVREGQEDFRVVLPPGRYRVASADSIVRPFEFHLRQGGVPDPVVLNPHTFSFELTNSDPNCTPEFSYNGVVVKELSELPFGTYRVKAPASCERRLPDKITVNERSEVTLRTEPERLDFVKEGQPIFLFVTTPAGSAYKLRF